MRIGLSEPATASLSAFANGSTGMATGGTKTAMTASTSNDAKASRTAVANSSGLAWAPRSTGSLTCRPSLRAASAARTPSAVELPMTASRGAGGQRLVSEEQGAVEQL